MVTPGHGIRFQHRLKNLGRLRHRSSSFLSWFTADFHVCYPLSSSPNIPSFPISLWHILWLTPICCCVIPGRFFHCNRRLSPHLISYCISFSSPKIPFAPVVVSLHYFRLFFALLSCFLLSFLQYFIYSLLLFVSAICSCCTDIALIIICCSKYNLACKRINIWCQYWWWTTNATGICSLDVSFSLPVLHVVAACTAQHTSVLQLKASGQALVG